MQSTSLHRQLGWLWPAVPRQSELDRLLDSASVIRSAGSVGWVIEVSTEPNFLNAENVDRVLEVFAFALRDDETLPTSKCQVAKDGMLQAVIGVREERPRAAEDIAAAGFFRGLEAAGYNTQKPGWKLNLRVLGRLPEERRVVREGGGAAA
jgi:hypothetical protein